MYGRARAMWQDSEGEHKILSSEVRRIEKIKFQFNQKQIKYQNFHFHHFDECELLIRKCLPKVQTDHLGR